jgi:hypothetical protein
MKTILKIILGIILIVLFVVITYVLYVNFTYYRIKDNTILNINNNQKETFEFNKEYKVLTYNVGFGAYDHDFSFFLDEAYTKDNKFISGKYAKAISKNNVINNTNKIIDILKENKSDVYLIQEIDKKANRSYFVNQVEELIKAFKGYSSVYTSNFHSAYLAYPLHDMIGKSESGLLTLSKYNFYSNIRRSYPVTNEFFKKFFDLDRAFSVHRTKLKNNKELVIVNSHMSAYDKGGNIRKKQLEMLKVFMKEEKEKGNYVIIGGDFNHDYANSKTLYMGDKKIPDWVFDLSDKDLIEGYEFVVPVNKNLYGTCRGAESPYDKNKTYQVVVDGFIISSNIEAESEIINTDYIASDHQPVVLKFKLKES